MTTTVKQYQNVSFKELMAYSENNPNRTRKLESIEILPLKNTQDTSLDKLGLNGYNAINLNPTGIISLLLCIDDPNYYSLATKNIRQGHISELATKLQQETDNLKNTEISRKRRKIYDLIGAAFNSSQIDEKDYLDLFHGISIMRNIHFVLVKEATQESIEEGTIHSESELKGEILFSSDPSNWKRDNDVYIVDYRARWVAVPSELSSKNIHFILGDWLSNIEQTGWFIKWYAVDNTKTELVEQLSQLSSWQPTDKKLTKEILGIRLNRHLTHNMLSTWKSRTNSTL